MRCCYCMYIVACFADGPSEYLKSPEAQAAVEAQVFAFLKLGSLGSTRAVQTRSCQSAGAMLPRNAERTVKSTELNQALDLLTKVLADPRLEPHQGKQLLCAKRELMNVLRSGKLEKRKVFLAVETIAAALLEAVQRNAD